MIDREVLFRKFQVTKKPNHLKHKPNRHHITTDNYEPHKGLVKAMIKCEKMHEKTNPKATLKLVRIEKKYASLVHKLREQVGG